MDGYPSIHPSNTCLANVRIVLQVIDSGLIGNRIPATTITAPTISDYLTALVVRYR